MIRTFCLLLVALVAASASHACELSSDMRSSVLATYVENATRCLAAPSDPAFAFKADLERLFINKVNAERRERDLAPLAVRDEMRDAARFHSLDMGYNDFFGHDSPLGRSHVYRLAALDRTLLTAGSAENVAKFGPIRCRNSLDQLVSCASAPGFSPPTAAWVVDDLHEKLMQSDGHRRNILDPAMTHIAVGVAYKDTGYYVSQLFVRPAGTLDTPLPLRLPAGTAIAQSVTIRDWTVKNFAMSADVELEDLRDNVIPADAAGDFTLFVRAEQRIRRAADQGQAMTARWMYPNGPRFTVTPSRETPQSR